MFAQQAIVVKAKNQSLNKIITALRNQYDVKLSFNDDKLASYVIDIDKSFSSVEDALRFLVKGLPLNIEQVNDVFIITSQRANPTGKKYLLSGNIVDGNDDETLPFASVIINGYPFVTDQKGNFSYNSNTNSSFNLHISYLGYFKLDTIVNANSNLTIKLFQNSIYIQEVVLSAARSEKTLDTSYHAGSLKINHTVGEYLPGSSDNSVYNLLRLQPGILAAGEQSNDLIIWGSYHGQTKISFDGFTVFGLKNFNDNIGAINPLITKDLSIQKGGYGVEQGDRVGGIVNITGIDGGKSSPKIKVGINNLTVNAMVSAPLFKNTSLVLAGRKTYYNLYKSNSQAKNTNQADSLIDLNLKPKYTFEDLNFKFSGRSNKGDDYYLSLFTGKDDFYYSYNTIKDNLIINGSNKETNQQYGGAAFYSKVWKNGSISNITFASSGLNSKILKNIELQEQFSINQNITGSSNLIKNNIYEQSIKLTHKLASTKKSTILLGLGYLNDGTVGSQNFASVNQVGNLSSNKRINAYVEDSYFITPKFKVVPGIRADYGIELNNLYLQPRLAAVYKFNNNFKLSAAWGLYRQFIAYNAVTDDLGNYRYQWTISDDVNIPIYKAQHWVLGSSYEKNHFWFDVDLYYKNIDGITSFIINRQGQRNLSGDGKAYGINFLIKKEYKGSMAWISYSLGKTLERFQTLDGNTKIQSYHRAPQDQKHELKFAGVLSLNSFFFSANYVFGSGFPSTNPIDDLSKNKLVYNRLDVATTYRFSKKKYHLDAGISILNVSNAQNIKSSNFQIILTQKNNTLNVYSQAVPFTPTLFLKFSL